MSNQWTKSSDYVSYDEAVAQAALYAETLLSAEKSAVQMEQGGIKKNDPGYLQTLKEIKYKRELLAIAEFKVKRAWNRQTKSDRKTNKKHAAHKSRTTRSKKKSKSRKKSTTRRR